MKFQLLSIFPELFSSFSSTGLVGKAVANKQIEISCINFRDYAVNTQGQVDDTPYGGGSGMLLRPEPAVAAIEKAKSLDPKARVVLLSPRGERFTQHKAQTLADECSNTGGGLIFLCPRYEGVDERVTEHWVDLELSIGDYVLMGGESAAMVVVESIARLLPNVLGNPESTSEESFADADGSLLEYPQYTKPSKFRDHQVPDVLLSGHHEEIRKWRHEKALEDTKARRPDLRQDIKGTHPNLSIALIHHPVVDKNGDMVTSSITNIDLHDIARSARTYGVEKFYVVHPTKTLRRLAQKIFEHWDTGFGSTYNPNRKEALALISIMPDFDDVLLDIESSFGMLPKIITSSATASGKTTSFSVLRSLLHDSEEPHLLILGTAWGLASEMHERADYLLEPISGCKPDENTKEYNHLSVRAAAAILLDRLLRD